MASEISRTKFATCGDQLLDDDLTSLVHWVVRVWFTAWLANGFKTFFAFEWHDQLWVLAVWTAYVLENESVTNQRSTKSCDSFITYLSSYLSMASYEWFPLIIDWPSKLAPNSEDIHFIIASGGTRKSYAMSSTLKMLVFTPLRRDSCFKFIFLILYLQREKVVRESWKRGQRSDLPVTGILDSRWDCFIAHICFLFVVLKTICF